MKKKKRNWRGFAAICLVFAAFGVFSAVLIKVQLVDGEAYAAASNSLTPKTVVVKAARGEILDRNGLPLIVNRQGNSIIFESAFFPTAREQEQRNTIIAALIRLFEESGAPWQDNLPLVFDAEGRIAFAPDMESDVAAMKSKDMLNLNDYATAQNCFDALIERYGLKAYKPEEARKIASVCYELKRIGFSVSNPYTFAEDVSVELVAKIKENSSFYKGVEVEIVPYREYADGTVAPHVLGMTGAISAENYKQLKAKGYKLNDTVGINGIEAAMEDYLRGTNGEKTVSTDSEGNITTKITKQPVQGNTVILTIDSNLQRVAQAALKEVLTSFKTPVEPAGSVVVLKVDTGEVLACATYPSYDISTYKDNYQRLAQASGSPLWNRALMSTYEWGSTTKPSVAIAALEENVLAPAERFYCPGAYQYYGRRFKCEQYHASRRVNVVNAIKESCNVFFYEMGDRVGIAKMNEYRTLLGMGQKTGVEINEAPGRLDSPEYRKTLGQTWVPGFTIQSAIGQAGNLFTPIQMVNYCATIANGGTRYQPHFIQSIRSYDFSKTVIEKTPVVVCQTGFSKGTLDLVRNGMELVCSEGYCGRVFAGLPVKAAAKTGTSQVMKTINGKSTKINNGLLICYAPAEKPEIAVALVAEGFQSGTKAAAIAAKIYDYYFRNTGSVEPALAENTLVG